MENHKSRHITNIKSNLVKYGSCSSDFDLNPDMNLDQKFNFLEASVLIPILTFKKDLEIVQIDAYSKAWWWWGLAFLLGTQPLSLV